MEFTRKPSQAGFPAWYNGREKYDAKRDIEVWVKVVDEPHEIHGVDGGKIIKLTIKLGDEYIAVYERGWGDTPVPEEFVPLYESILAQFN
jgi:hypothetical protein